MEELLLSKHHDLVNQLENSLYRAQNSSNMQWMQKEIPDYEESFPSTPSKKRGRGRPKKGEEYAFSPVSRKKGRDEEQEEQDSEIIDDDRDFQGAGPKHHMLQSKREKKSKDSATALSATSSVEWTAMVPGSPDLSSSFSSLPDKSLLPHSLGVRSIPCFQERCTYSYQRPTSDQPEFSDRPLLLPPKFDGFSVRACKKHADRWKSCTLLPSSCEICRGLNHSSSEAPKPRTNTLGGAPFLLCNSCTKRQGRMLGLKESLSSFSEENLHESSRISDNDSNCAMSDSEMISDPSPTFNFEHSRENSEKAQKEKYSKSVSKSAGNANSEKVERYLEHFEKIEQWNRSHLSDLEVSATAFRWFCEIGFEILHSKGKVTIPIEFRLPAKKGLANNFKGGNVDHLFGRNPYEWGYVVQLEALDLVRAREDCWVTFKSSHDWDAASFEEALRCWSKKLGEGWAPILLPVSLPRTELVSSSSAAANHSPKKERVEVFNEDSSNTHVKSWRKEKNGRKDKPSKNSLEKTGVTSKIEALQQQAESTGPKLNEIPFGDIVLNNTGDRKAITTGRHGAVYKGLWKGIAVAVRFPLVKLPISSSDRLSFFKTIERASKIIHPNVVTNYACCASEQLCILSEFMNLGNLRDFLINFSEEITVMYFAKIATDVARAMDYLHFRGIYHCSLSSKNVMMKGEIVEGGIIAGMEVKIADVGFNSTLETRIESDSPFLAPEVLKSQMHTSFSDVYSYGTILRHLFSGGSDEPLTISELEGKGVDSQWLNLISQCHQVVPEQRPTFGQILNHLGAMSNLRRRF